MVLQQPARSIPIPALESGDRLTRAEFERRYEATPEKFKAELIEGIVYVASPVRALYSSNQTLRASSEAARFQDCGSQYPLCYPGICLTS